MRFELQSHQTCKILKLQVQPFDDFGSWQCHITRKRGHESISESTRKTIVAPPGAVERRAAAAKEAAKEKARPQTVCHNDD